MTNVELKDHVYATVEVDANIKLLRDQKVRESIGLLISNVYSMVKDGDLKNKIHIKSDDNETRHIIVEFRGFKQDLDVSTVYEQLIVDDDQITGTLLSILLY